MLLRSDINVCTYGEYAFVIAAVTQQQIDFDDYISRNGYVLRTENRRAHTFVIAVGSVCKEQFFRKVSVSAYDGYLFTCAVSEERCAGN